MVPMERNLQTLEDIPHAWGVFLPHCGHWVMVERPREFCEMTLRFFELGN